MAYYGPFQTDIPRQMPLRSLSPMPATPAAAMQQRWQQGGEYVGIPMQQPTMAAVRTKRIFGINVPQRTIQSVVGGLAAGLAAGADGNFTEGLAGGLGGALGGGMLYDRQMRLEQQAQDEAQQRAIENERAMRALGIQAQNSQLQREEFNWRRQQPPKVAEAPKTPQDIYAEARARNQAARDVFGPRNQQRPVQLTAWQQAQIDAYIQQNPGATVSDAVAALSFNRPTVNSDITYEYDPKTMLLKASHRRTTKAGATTPDPLGLR